MYLIGFGFFRRLSSPLSRCHPYLPALEREAGSSGHWCWCNKDFYAVSGWSMATDVSVAELKYSYHDHQSGPWLLSWKTARLPWIVCGFGCCNQVVSCPCFQAFALMKVLAKSTCVLDNCNLPKYAHKSCGRCLSLWHNCDSHRLDEVWHLECSPWSIYPWCSTRQMHALPPRHPFCCQWSIQQKSTAKKANLELNTQATNKKPPHNTRIKQWNLFVGTNIARGISSPFWKQLLIHSKVASKIWDHRDMLLQRPLTTIAFCSHRNSSFACKRELWKQNFIDTIFI